MTKEKIIIREKYLSRIRKFYDSNYIKIITGIRRCGKSEILKQIISEHKKNGIHKKQIIFIDLESASDHNIKTHNQLIDRINKEILNKKKFYIFIDEIQNVTNFEEALAAIRNSFNCSIFVTGSNSKLLKGKMEEKLTGRAKEFEILPFTYLECAEYAKKNKTKKIDIFNYLDYGGMPQRFEEVNPQGINKYLKGLYQSIIKKDVFKQHKKINKNIFNKISNYVLTNSGQIFSAPSIAKYLKNEFRSKKIASIIKTIYRYIEYLEESYIIKECLPYFIKGKEALKGARKFYPMDIGLKTSLINDLSIDYGFALEAIIFNELIYRGYDVYYGKLRNGEIDFVAKKGNKKCFIQVSYKMDRVETLNREYNALLKIKDASPKYVFSLDEKDTSRNGIIHINVRDFLENKIDIQVS